MATMLGRVWVRGVLLVTAVAAAACSSGPTKPTEGTTTPTPAPTVKTCTAGAPEPMTSFTADPATITNGDPFTLRWAAPCGFVSLAQKGQGPFQILLPSTGSYALQAGMNGYPTATGDTTYEARNADTATPREATVTVNASGSGGGGGGGGGKATPTPTPGGTATPTPTASATATPTPTPTPVQSCPTGTSCTTNNVCKTGGVCASDGKTCNESNKASGTLCSGTCEVCDGSGHCNTDDVSKCGGDSSCQTCNGGDCANKSNTTVCSGTCRTCDGNGSCNTDKASLCNDGNSCHTNFTCSNGTCGYTNVADGTVCKGTCDVCSSGTCSVADYSKCGNNSAWCGHCDGTSGACICAATTQQCDSRGYPVPLPVYCDGHCNCP